MFGWINALFHGIVSVAIGGLALIGIGTIGIVTPIASTTPSTVESSATTTLSEVDQLKLDLEQEKAARLQLEQEVNGSKKANTSTVPAQTNKKTTNFTTPSGAALDSSANVISAPQTSQTVTGGQGVLTTKQIVALLSPSIALITTPSGAGSGFVINGGKYILTNAHVVGSYQTVTIHLPNYAVFDAPVLGKNSNFDVDLAIIYVGDHKPPFVSLGSSDTNSLSVGDDVFVLGYPLSTTQNLINLTLTKGILSARQTPSWATRELLQTDAAINHGNSGGPMVNDMGQVVGINTYTDADPLSQTQGIYFAIPIDLAKAWIPSLSQYGQSRYEVYPIGSTLTIKRSVKIKIDYNDTRSCSYLLPDEDLPICDLYKNHHNDYTWTVFDDLSQHQ